MATKGQCQSTPELCKIFHGIRGLQHTMSYSCVVLVMQLMGILMFQLLICLCPEGWFSGNNFPDQNLEVIRKGILPIHFSSGVDCRNHLLIHLWSPLTEKHSSGGSPGHQMSAGHLQSCPYKILLYHGPSQ